MTEVATGMLLAAQVGEGVLVPAAIAGEVVAATEAALVTTTVVTEATTVVGATGTAASTATGLFGLSLGATIGIAVVGAVVIGGIGYLIYKKYSRQNQQTNNQPQQTIPPPISVPPRNIENFTMPQLPQHSDILSSWSDALTINSQQITELNETYSCSISYTLMVVPVLGTCCNVRYYEKVVLESIVDQTGTCPFCRRNITRDNIVEIAPLKIAIREFRKRLAKRAQRVGAENSRRWALIDVMKSILIHIF